MKFVGARIADVGSLFGKSCLVMRAAGIAHTAWPISVFDRLVGGLEFHRAIRTCIVPARGLVKYVRPRVSAQRFGRSDDTRQSDRHCTEDRGDPTPMIHEQSEIQHNGRASLTNENG